MEKHPSAYCSLLDDAGDIDPAAPCVHARASDAVVARAPHCHRTRQQCAAQPRMQQAYCKAVGQDGKVDDASACALHDVSSDAVPGCHASLAQCAAHQSRSAAQGDRAHILQQTAQGFVCRAADAANAQSGDRFESLMACSQRLHALAHSSSDLETHRLAHQPRRDGVLECSSACPSRIGDSSWAGTCSAATEHATVVNCYYSKGTSS